MDDKTEPATPRRRKKAREDGQVARSAELVGCAVLLGGLLGAQSLLPGVTQRLTTYFVRTLSSMGGDPGPDALRQMAGDSLMQVALISLPALMLALAVGVGCNVLQVGITMTPKLLMARLDRVDPFQGIRRIFTARSLVELIKGLLKVAIVASTGWSYLSGRWGDVYGLAGSDPQQIASRIGALTYGMGLQMVGTLSVLAALDYAYQRWQFERSLRMTKQEVKDELRDAEGSPETRMRIRQRQREFARRRMMADVPKATVVIANPTHFAVALRYELGQTGAPRVVAKGQDRVALRIREIAEENGVPVVENPPLARALHAQSELGQEVPVDLYRAVAEVLAMIWSLDSRHRPPSARSN